MYNSIVELFGDIPRLQGFEPLPVFIVCYLFGGFFFLCQDNGNPFTTALI